MTLEVEQKFRVADLDRVVAQVAALHAQFGPPQDQVDCYYAHPARDFAATDEALRVRTVGNDNRVTYKGPKIDQSTKTRREIELPIEAGVDGARRFGELLVALGFRPVRAVHKQRRTAHVDWQGQAIEVALDVVEGAGTFVELELAADESTVDTARAAIASLAEHLHLCDSERRSYLELLLAQ